ncbi:hypothetical protein BCR42DRAFT_438092 [Absidia repens]|uniref:RNA helicase aquarius N-terminal domain-containing protein n=1 Tax=Absidia repens TaxID=90262 RepID=A0A1X2IGC5_9FUNG|nr:hypothetical protein BCR42DRAFT_438092 [Absidia repens]
MYLLDVLVLCLQSLENPTIRSECLKLVSIGIWQTLSHESKRENIFNEYPPLRKLWNTTIKSTTLQKIYQITAENDVDEDLILYCERFLEFLIDLEAQLPTRRFFNTLLNDHQTVVLCHLAPFICRKEKDVDLIKQLLETLAFYAKFEINDQTGLALTDLDMTEQRSAQLIQLQHIVFQKYKNTFPDFPLANLVEAIHSGMNHGLTMVVGPPRSEFLQANAGMTYDYQFIDVGPDHGQGESEPVPYFYQNLGEAEYVVALSIYLLNRTFYYHWCEQKRSAIFVMFGLIVVMSCARFGLYVFGCRRLFGNCYELKPVFDQLLARPDKLCLHHSEAYPTQRLLNVHDGATEMDHVEEMGNVVFKLSQEQVNEDLVKQQIQDETQEQSDQRYDGRRSRIQQY